MGLPLSAAVTLGLLFFLSVGLNKQVAEGCRCVPKELQQALCHSDTVFRAKITGQVKNNQLTAYSINMIKRFKHVNKKPIRVIYSHHDSCEIYLENKEYLLSGNVSDGMIFVNSCDLAKHWDSVSSDEKQYLRMCPTGCDCIKI
ncbi:metalloproteinase inhibitor 3-like isoform X2 [Labeo rohita]|uniref:metalloproteinase inhibitor 3-like isoform X2 n=1 Tax=Labeo rohita TaxID=84645 RepID=UPI0021E28EB5|nr:metalloproteinase inhibitor 3-like isoform X2 [Labeo rohita]